MNQITSLIIRNKKLLLFSGSIFIAFCLFFSYLWKFVYTDIQLHAAFVRGFLFDDAIIPSNFMYYLLLLVFTGGNYSNIAYASVFLLAIFSVGKYLASLFVLKKIISEKEYNVTQVSFIIILNLLTFAIFIPTLRVDRYYLGFFPANVWHNSTIIAVFPFSILLFYYSYRYLQTSKGALSIFFMILLNAVFKPSYLFVFIIAFPLFALIHNGISKIYSIIKFILFTALIIFIQYIVTYYLFPWDKSGVTVSPFSTFKAWMDVTTAKAVLYYLVSLILSYLFPISILFYKQKRSEPLFVYSLIGLVISHLIFIFIAETGYRAMHGNFVWQIFICSFLIFLVSSYLMKNEIIDFFKKGRISLAPIFLIIHVCFGVLYIVLRLIISKSYL
jgi:hypothetical protein